MRRLSGIGLVIAAALLVGCNTGNGMAGDGVAAIEAAGTHHIVTPETILWQAGPAALPSGAEMAILEGDPAEAGVFTMRLRVPDGYMIPPHRHPRTERVTVLEGNLMLGMSRFVEREDTLSLEPGSYFSMSPDMVHFVIAEGETVVQITGVGPWDVLYVNPADDPRN